MGNHGNGRRSGCPINIALELFGDRWSLLIVRDMMFNGYRTFNQFLGSGEGIATNILSDRLSRLEAGGILTKERDADDARRTAYRLTEKGIKLGPVLVEIFLWSARYEDTDAQPETVQAMHYHRDHFLAAIRRRWSMATSQNDVRSE